MYINDEKIDCDVIHIGTLLPTLHGKVIATALADQENGYDRVTLIFTDGTKMVVLEEGQCGWFSIAVPDA